MERRRWERFTSTLQARARVSGGGTSEEVRLETKDISAGGVSLKTNHPWPVGTEVDLEVDLSPGEFRRFEDSIMKGSGSVIRIGEGEMAVSFREEARIMMAKGVRPLGRKGDESDG